MARGGAASFVLLVILLVAGSSAAAAVSGGGIIRLPSDTRGVDADLVTATASAKQSDEKRPWDCCDEALCFKIFPPRCRCFDAVDRCSDACKQCEEIEDGSRQRCNDWYQLSIDDYPLPRCHEGENGRAGMVVLRGAKKKEGQERPWKCCDKPVLAPTTTEENLWYCTDKLEECTCDHCHKLEDGSHRSYCLDGYEGSEPGPPCSHHQ